MLIRAARKYMNWILTAATRNDLEVWTYFPRDINQDGGSEQTVDLVRHTGASLTLLDRGGWGLLGRPGEGGGRGACDGCSGCCLSVLLCSVFWYQCVMFWPSVTALPLCWLACCPHTASCLCFLLRVSLFTEQSSLGAGQPGLPCHSSHSESPADIYIQSSHNTATAPTTHHPQHNKSEPFIDWPLFTIS